jgi:hypothetical protein
MSTILLVVRDDKTTTSQRDPEAQVIAEAIAPCQHNIRPCPQLSRNALLHPQVVV